MADAIGPAKRSPTEFLKAVSDVTKSETGPCGCLGGVSGMTRWLGSRTPRHRGAALCRCALAPCSVEGADARRRASAGDWSPSCRQAEHWGGLPGSAGVPRWLHEHCNGTNRGVRERAAQEQVWRRLHPWQQRALYQHCRCQEAMRKHKSVPRRQLADCLGFVCPGCIFSKFSPIAGCGMRNVIGTLLVLVYCARNHLGVCTLELLPPPCAGVPHCAAVLSGSYPRFILLGSWKSLSSSSIASRESHRVGCADC